MGVAVIAFWLRVTGQIRGIENDLFWHLDVGRWILAHHAVPTRDIYSWTAAGRRWLDQEWLGEALLAKLFASGGARALFALHWLLLAAIFLGLLSVYRAAGAEFGLAAIGALVSSLLLFGVFTLRLQVFSVLGLVLTVRVLQAWWSDGRIPGWAWFFPAWVVLWANLHGGGAIIGPATLAIALSVEVLARRRDRIGPLAILAAVSAACLLINPAGVRLIAYSLRTLGDPRVRAMNAAVMEWQPFDLHDQPFQFLLAYLGWLLVTGWSGKVRVPRSQLAVAVVWGAFGLTAMRNVPLAIVGSAPLAATLLARCQESLGAWPRGRKLAVVLYSLALVGMNVIPAAALLRQGRIENGSAFPSPRAIAALKRDCRDCRLLNYYDWGGIISFLAYPEVKVFIDGRQYLFGPRLMAAHDSMIWTEPGWRSDLARYRIDAVFVPARLPLVRALAKNPAWKIRYAGPESALIVRES